MTVFLTMLLGVMIFFLLAVYSAVKIDGGKKDALMRSAVSVRGILGDHCRPLWDRYGILAIDGGYDTGSLRFSVMENRIRDLINKNDSLMPYAGDDVFAEEVEIKQAEMLIESSGRNMKDAIGDYVRERLAVRAAAELFRGVDDANEALEKKDSMVDELEEGKRTEEDYYREAEGTSMEGETGEVAQDPGDVKEDEDPRISMNKLMRKGFFALVLPKDFSLSQRKADLSCCYREGAKGATMFISDFRSYDDVAGGLSSFGGFFEKAEEDIYLNEYILGVLGNALSLKEDTCLDYETEFIIGGTASDEENLKKTLNKILLLRTSLNGAHILSDSVKSGEASAAATALTLWWPPLQPGVYMLIVSAWAYGEGLIDVRTLMKGYGVPMIKNASEWKLSFSGLLAVTETGIDSLTGDGSRGPGYEGYLRLLLYAMGETEKYERLAGIIEANIKTVPGYKEFCIRNAVTGIDADCRYHINRFGPYTVNYKVRY